MSDSWFPYEPRSSTPRSQRGGRGRAPLNLTGVLDPGHLFGVMDGLRRHNGQAPGVDRVRPGDVSRGEWGQAFRDVRAAVLAGTYRPQPTRRVDRPKKGGGTRPLNLPTAADKVLAKAVSQVFTRLGERAFRPSSYGFRPGRDRFDLQADLLARAELAGLRVVTADDVTRAFDRVPVAAASAALAGLGADPALAALAGVVLQGHDAARPVGIGQGCPLSPVALNALLHSALDEPLAAAGDTGAADYRYVDNLLHLTATAAQGRERLGRTRGLLAAVGLELKGQPGVPRDLDRGETVDVLGLVLRVGDDGRLRYDVADDSWAGLDTKLADAHHAPHPPETARQLVRGWVAAHAPALGRPGDAGTADRLSRLLDAAGHQHALHPDRIAACVAAAGRRWAEKLSAARRQVGETVTDATPGEGPRTRYGHPAHATAGLLVPTVPITTTTTGGTHTHPGPPAHAPGAPGPISPTPTGGTPPHPGPPAHSTGTTGTIPLTFTEGTHTHTGLPAPTTTGTPGPIDRTTPCHTPTHTGHTADRADHSVVTTPVSNGGRTGGDNSSPHSDGVIPLNASGQNPTACFCFCFSRPSGRSTAPSDRSAVPCGAPPSNTFFPRPADNPRTHPAPDVRPRPPPGRRGRAPPARSPRPPRPP